MSSPRPVAGFAPPDFGGASLLNFAATLEAALAGSPRYPLLADAQVRSRLLGARHLVVWLIDGLGIEPLQALSPRGALAQAVCTEIEAVFPSSTAPTLTALMTARSPAIHAVPEWFLWLDELGAIYRSLPLDTRDPFSGRPPIDDASAIYPQPSLMARAQRPCTVVLPAAIAQSAYSRYTHATARTLAYSGEESFLAAVAAAVDAQRDGGYVYAYVDWFDQVAHEFGCASDEAHAVVHELDRWFERLAQALAPRGALLVATSDHGFIDVPAHLRYQLDACHEILGCLERPLCGGPRTPFAYVREGRREVFPSIVERQLGADFVAVPSTELIDAGWFGPDAPDPRLRERIGTHILLPKTAAYLVDRLPGESGSPMIGVHGGMSSAERRVPLILAGDGHG